MVPRRALVGLIGVMLAGCGARQRPATPAHAPSYDATAPEVTQIALPAPDEPAADQQEPSDDPMLASDADPRPDGATKGFGGVLRDERASWTHPRAPAQVSAELRGLANLCNTTPRTSPDRSQLLRRLAEAYVELAASSPDTEAGQNALRDSIQAYTTLRQEYPNDSRADEVLYYLALSYERVGDANNARKAYYDLIQIAPRSAFVPLAYLAFAEFFFREAETDPMKLDLARAAYEEVAKYPPPANRAACYARYQRGAIFRRAGDAAQADAAFDDALRCATSYSALPGSPDIGRAARGAFRGH